MNSLESEKQDLELNSGGSSEYEQLQNKDLRGR